MLPFWCKLFNFLVSIISQNELKFLVNCSVVLALWNVYCILDIFAFKTQAGKVDKKNNPLFLLCEPHDPSRLEHLHLSHVEVMQRSNFSSLLRIPFIASVMYVCLCLGFPAQFFFFLVFFNGLVLKDYFPHLISFVGEKKMVYGSKFIPVTNWIPILAFHTGDLCWWRT